MDLFAENVLLPTGLVPALVSFEGGTITRVLPRPSGEQLPEGTLTLGFGYLVPGLIDLQINGFYGVDFSTSDESAINSALRELPGTGTTSICPTVITGPTENLIRQIQLIEQIGNSENQARNLGVHLEGPFLNSEKKGAHDESQLLKPNSAEKLLKFLGKIKLLTLAPELEGAIDLIKQAVTSGSIVSLGHTMATSEEFQKATTAGAKMVTHLFNGQRPIHQREPGISIAALVDEDVYFGIIVDGEHVHFDLIRLAQNSAADRMIVVSDASAALRAPAGKAHSLGGQDLIVDQSGAARRSDGTLASSGLTQLEAIENAVAAGVNREKLLRSATEVPAKLLGRNDIGQIAVGAKADLVYYENKNHLEVLKVYLGGQPWKP